LWKIFSFFDTEIDYSIREIFSSVPPSLRNSIANQLIFFIFSVASLWHSLCNFPGHDFLPRISALPIQWDVLADRIPVGNMPTVEHPDYSAHLETGDGTFRTGTWG
jgi:hypothetical protein